MSTADLTPEQRQVVELPVAERALVVAGPGTGKTHTLRHRIVHLAVTEQVIGSDELLVLSFTNAVVRELRERLADEPRASAMRPTTIDALARRIVGMTEDLNHDRIMAMATKRVAGGMAGSFDDLRHVIVDEIQDLGGLRREFVEAILTASDAGCTLLGDPAQGIYGFGDPGSITDPVGVLAGVPRIQSYVLTIEHRFLSQQVRLPSTARTAVVERKPSAWQGLRRHLRDIKPIPGLDQLAIILRRSDSSTAVLSRTNGEILWLYEQLYQRGVAHQIKRRADDVVVESWPALVLGNVTTPFLSRKVFGDLVEERFPHLEVTAGWRTLKRLATSTDGRSVDMSRLRSRLLDRPVDLRAEELPDRPILSTIHRSKGLQYDRVILQEPAERQDDLVEESRVLYVAMTRARKILLPLTRPQADGRMNTGIQGRWTLRTWPGHPLALEVRVGDVVQAVPSGGEAAAEVQEYIRRMVRVGDRVHLRRNVSMRTFEVLHDQTVVAAVSPKFQEAAESFRSKLPDLMEGPRIDAVTTSVGDPGVAAELGLPASGLWLGVEISGLLRVTGGRS